MYSHIHFNIIRDIRAFSFPSYTAGQTNVYTASTTTAETRRERERESERGIKNVAHLLIVVVVAAAAADFLCL